MLVLSEVLPLPFLFLGLSGSTWNDSLQSPNPLVYFLLPSPHPGSLVVVVIPLAEVDLLALEHTIPSANH